MFINAKASWPGMRLTRALLLVLFGLQLAACATSEVSRNERGGGAPGLEPETARLQEGMEYFRKADYAQALAVFDELGRTTKSEAVRRKALYGQACARLITAQTADEYVSALAVWQSWSRLPSAGEGEDPRMLSSILERISPTLPIDSKTAAIQATKPKKKPGSIYINKDLASYKNMVENKDKELDRMKSRLDSREREVRRLKQQIESLEAIHLKFQERQKEISTP